MRAISLSLFIMLFTVPAFFSACGYDKQNAVNDDNPPSGEIIPAADPCIAGPTAWTTFTTGLASENYESAVVYYPADTPEDSLPAAVVTHGWMAEKEKMTWLAERLASHGYIVLLFTSLVHGNLLASPSDWVTGHTGAIAKLKEENLRPDSPLYQIIDTDRIAIMGHSMGGGGALHTADAMSDEIAAVIGLTPYELGSKPGENITVPVLVITGENDSVANASMGRDFYDAIAEGTPKLFMTITDMVHDDVQNEGSFHEAQSMAVISWLNYHLKDDDRYLSWLTGEEKTAAAADNWYTAYLFEGVPITE